MKQVHCSLSYHQTPNDQLEAFAGGIVAGYYANNPPFTVITITLLAFQALIADYATKLTAYTNGGETQKGPFLLAKAALMSALDSLATETDKVADGDSSIIILAGYTPTKTPGEKVKPGQAVITVKRGIPGELIVTCAKLEGADHYGCIMVEGSALPPEIVIDANGRIVVDTSTPPGPGPAPSFVSFQLDFTDQREKHFTNLKHDVTYYFYMYAVNAKGVGPLSVGVSMVCW